MLGENSIYYCWTVTKISKLWQATINITTYVVGGFCVFAELTRLSACQGLKRVELVNFGVIWMLRNYLKIRNLKCRICQIIYIFVRTFLPRQLLKFLKEIFILKNDKSHIIIYICDFWEKIILYIISLNIGYLKP